MGQLSPPPLSPTWQQVAALRERLRHAPLPELGLSPAGAAHARDAALGALHDEALAAVAALGGQPFRSATVVAARTVFTAPLEWLAVLWGRGTPAPCLKLPAGAPGWGPTLAQAAADVGLSLTLSEDHAAVNHAELVVVMGGDEAVRAVRQAIRPSARLLAHGHRISAAYIAEDQPEAWAGLAEDLALYDTRGCYSPAAIYTSVPLDRALPALAQAMAAAQARWPRGEISGEEAARLRALHALGLATGQHAQGEGWLLSGGPLSAPQGALPRAARLMHAPSAQAAADALRPLSAALSAIACDRPADAPAFIEAGATRICRPGQLQRPPLNRPHDGEDWLRGTARWVAQH